MLWAMHGLRPLFAAPALALVAACAAGSRAPSTEAIPMDIHSHAQPNRVRVAHVALDLELDFDARRAGGTAELVLVRTDPAAPLVLDVQGLEIESVTGADGAPRTFELGPEDPSLGGALSIELRPGDDRVTVAYRTTDGADALQWLAPEQTVGGERPFLYTQGQAVLTRTWIPLQDTPGVRATYDARIRAPEGLTVVMSAEQLGRDEDGAYRFRMPQPIPSYLIALAAGDLAFEPISERCGVYAEPAQVVGARNELVDTEAMIAAAEELFGPYRWGRYDLIVLPPAFPYGGMENPRLTFATPTILAGDRSLVALVAHELAHSWSGNLVTNATWSDFWLNEGFTVYLEKRIMEAVFGAERARMEILVERDSLEKEMAEMDPRDQVLNIDLADRHPDDGFSGVPYDKGALFLRRIEQVVGRQAFDAFLGGYFDAHAFQSIRTADFEAYLGEHLPAAVAAIDLQQWLHEPGLPDDAPRTESAALQVVDDARAQWLAGTPAAQLGTSGWITHQWLHFLEGMPADLGSERMTALDDAFGFSSSGNSEILCVWLRLAIQHGYLAAGPRLEEFLMTVGRRKYLSPLYKELVKTDDGRRLARDIYARARPRYHAVSSKTLDGILGWSEQGG